jgi:hypothetical protein
MWKVYARVAFFSLLNSFLIGFLAVPAAAVALGFPAGTALTAFEYGWAMVAILFGTGLVFNQYEAWHHFTPNLTLAGVLCDDDRRMTWTAGWLALIGMIFSLGGYFIAHAIAQAIYGFSLASASTITSMGFFGDFFIEFIGMTLVCHIYLFSSREYNGVWGVVGIAIVQGALIAIFGPATGGSFNFWRTLAVGALEGNLSLTGWGPKLLATFVAPIFTCIVKFFFSDSKMRK